MLQKKKKRQPSFECIYGYVMPHQEANTAHVMDVGDKRLVIKLVVELIKADLTSSNGIVVKNEWKQKVLGEM